MKQTLCPSLAAAAAAHRNFHLFHLLFLLLHLVVGGGRFERAHAPKLRRRRRRWYNEKHAVRDIFARQSVAYRNRLLCAFGSFALPLPLPPTVLCCVHAKHWYRFRWVLAGASSTGYDVIIVDTGFEIV